MLRRGATLPPRSPSHYLVVLCGLGIMATVLLLDGCHNPDGAKMLAATLTRADFEENLVGVLGVLADAQGIDYVYRLTSYLPFLGLLTVFLPDLRNGQAEARPMRS